MINEFGKFSLYLLLDALQTHPISHTHIHTTYFWINLSNKNRNTHTEILSMEYKCTKAWHESLFSFACAKAYSPVLVVFSDLFIFFSSAKQDITFCFAFVFVAVVITLSVCVSSLLWHRTGWHSLASSLFGINSTILYAQ